MWGIANLVGNLCLLVGGAVVDGHGGEELFDLLLGQKPRVAAWIKHPMEDVMEAFGNIKFVVGAPQESFPAL